MLCSLCSFCKKRPPAIFMSIGGKSPILGICLRCARNMNAESLYKMMKDSQEPAKEIVPNIERVTWILSNILANIDSNTEENSLSLNGAVAMIPFMKNIFSDISFPKNFESKNEKNTTEKIRKPQRKKFIEMYCDNLTKKAKNNQLDRIIGRETEISRVIQILCRRTKNNPCLIGEPGVGKTAIAEGLALRITEGKVPLKLKNKEICLLDLTALVAGTQFRGQFESRIKGLIEEIENDENIILFIDEVHNLVGTGDSEGSMSAANILKPALSRGKIQVIGATTFVEYRKYIERDAALERRFQQIKISEPSIAKTIELIIKVKFYYEDFHRVTLPDNLVSKIVLLSERYIIDRFLPDKAIDLLDESCAYAALSNGFLTRFDEINSKIKNLKSEKEVLPAETDKARLEEIEFKLSQLGNEAESIKKYALKAPVTEEDVAKVVELWTGVPSSKIQASEFKKLEDLENKIKKRIKGQDNAVAEVCAAIRRNRTRIDPKPLPASFIFIGPTGVGKTELSKILADELFNSRDNLIRIDMSEFMEKHAVSRIIGSPPGYIGYDESGQLTEKVRRKPYSIVLFDEIEKAHPDVMNILLQILDEGKVSDSHGKIVNFENTIIVMTSNAGNDKKVDILGFGKNENELTKEKALKSLSEFLRPEFLSRIDEIIVFNNLSKRNLIEISELILSDFVKHLSEKGINFSYDKNSLELLVKKLDKNKNGARGIKNLIRKEVEDKLASIIVNEGSFNIGNVLLSGTTELKLSISKF
ncbi:MAG: ATP-dependent Clp protease ATP-binding subunit [Oscillospiraceae bacterium]|nr:ATP-dependent Clp protease ATP-binding subunit [Oscillospiraceae bacterium]